MIVSKTAREHIAARRRVLLISTAAMGLGLSSAAQAQQADFAPVREAYDASTIIREVDPQIVIGHPGTPVTAIDPVNVNGVGQMVIDQQNGFIGLCTASLINPRTVVFAAHCVNEREATEYGDNSGGVPIGFFFSNDNFEGLLPWYFSAAGEHMSNPDLYAYNSNFVAYHPDSLDPLAASFLFSDVAVASLDIPAANVPTWAMLFSPLPPVDADENGTGYHVTVTGYGNNGTGDTGSVNGVDFRRRAAENMLGALASIDDFEGFLFGALPGNYPQNLYWIDFDDPRRGSGDEDPRDFNAWRDNPEVNEGITASGDSGGPLILDDTFDIDAIIGVLSGGYTRFFNDAPANGYGTASFYQPLYLYWDWIAANNPYHYVSAKAGDGNWEDGSHWQTELDPNYMIVDSEGNLVNGIPAAPGGGTSDTDGKFGEACFESGGVAECQDFYTGEYYIDFRDPGDPDQGPIILDGEEALKAGGERSNNYGRAQLSTIIEREAQAEGDVSPAAITTADLPTATLANGLPGATGFVPNNYDGDRLAGTPPRYFDVTLSADGTTTLNSDVVIDALSITGAGAALDIVAGASLTSWMDVNQYRGMMRVDGTLTTLGDYLLMTGGLQGSGTINTPYFTNVAGVIAPGGVGSAGTLTFNGNVILSDGSTYLVDIGADGTSDLIEVNATAYDGDEVPLDGMALLGGQLVFGSAEGAMVRDGYAYTILTAEGGIDGTFLDPGAISAILTPSVSYTDTSVLVEIEAGLYADVVSPGSAVQTAYAQLLDQNRSNYSTLADLYGPLDLQSAETIRSTLVGMAPAAMTLKGALGLAAVDTVARFTRGRLDQYTPGESGGTISMIGQPLELAAAATSSTMRAPSMGTGEAEMLANEGALPSTMRAYLAAGYVLGDSAPMTGYARQDEFDGWYGTLGLEVDVSPTAMLGVGLSYSSLSGDVTDSSQSAEGDLLQGTLYGKAFMEGGLELDGQVAYGSYNSDTVRMVPFLGTGYTLESEEDATVLNAEIGLGTDVAAAQNVRIAPRAALRYSSISFSDTQESGGPMALAYDMGKYESLQGRVGVTFEGTDDNLKPFMKTTYVHDFEDRPAYFSGGFAATSGPSALFPLTGTDKDWAELAGGVTFSLNTVDLTLSAETTMFRSDVDVHSFRGTVTLPF